MRQRHVGMVILVGLGLGLPKMARAVEPAKPPLGEPRRTSGGTTDRQVTVHGHGKITAVPDLARLTIEVSEEASSVEKADRLVRRKMDSVLKALKAQGMPDKDIQTQSYQVVPKMAMKDGATIRVGFTASNQIAVTLHDLKKTGTVLSAVLDSGANEIRGPYFELEHPQDLEHKALGLAFQEARAKASLLAEAAGAALGDAIKIDEGTTYQLGPRTVMALKTMSSMQTAEEPIKTGENTIEATVTATFALNQK